jgi:hypothetical protein
MFRKWFSDTTIPIMFQVVLLGMMVIFVTVYDIKDMVVISTVLAISFIAIILQIVTLNCFERQNS